MSEERISALERDVTAIRIAYAGDRAATNAAVEHLTKAVEELTQSVQQFRDTLNKGKGAVWLFGLIATCLGGLVSWAMTRIFQG